MKSNEKSKLTLENSTEEVGKRYKALLSIKKASKDQTGDENYYIYVLNNSYQSIFNIITEKIAKIPTSAFEKLVHFSSPMSQLNEILEFMSDIFKHIDLEGLKDLLIRNKIKIIVILYKFLDYNTKIEIKKTAFSFLLRIIDSFEDLKQVDKEYIALFNFALDHQTVREGLGKPLFSLKINDSNPSSTQQKTLNEYLQTFYSFQELNKVITESSSVVKTDEGIKEIFNSFIEFFKKKKEKARAWFGFFRHTWRDIYFNDEESKEETSNVGIFEEVKKRGLTCNINLKRLFFSLWECIVKDKIFTLSKEDLFLVIDWMQIFSWDGGLRDDLNKILKIFYDFVAKKFTFKTEEECDDLIRKRIIQNLNTVCFHQLLFDLNQSEYEYIPTPTHENLCFNIFGELFKQHGNRYSPDIFNTVQWVINTSISQNGSTPKDYLYPLIEIVFIITIKAENIDRAQYRDYLKTFFDFKEIVLKINDFFLKKTEAFILASHNDTHYELLKHLQICSGEKSYPMKIEFLMQQLLQEFCLENKEITYFDHEKSASRILSVIADKAEIEKNEKLAKAYAEIRTQFQDWIVCLIVLYDLEFMKNKSTFPFFCQGISKVIHLFIEPEAIQPAPTTEKVKSAPKPKYSLPTETLYQLFGHYFNIGLSVQDKSKLEGKYWAIKAYLKIFCQTQSEIFIMKSIVIEVISFLNSSFQSFSRKDADIDTFVNVCVILKYTEQIFLTDYPGIKIMIPNYLQIIENILSSEKFNQLDSSTKTMLETVFFESDKKSEPQSLVAVVKNAALKIMKSILFMGYAVSGMGIVNLNEEKSSSPEKKTMEIVREKGFSITYKVLERMSNLKPKGVKATSLTEFDDLELQHNLFTMGAIIIYLECSYSNTVKNDHSLEDFIDLYIQQFSFDISTMSPEHLMLHVQAAGTLAFLITDGMKFYTKIFKLIISNLTSSLLKISKGQVTQQKREVAAELLFVLLKWILNDKSRVLVKESITQHGLIEMMKTFSMIPDFKDLFEMFFSSILINYNNFPLKNQKKDNNKSIFEETSFREFRSNYFENLDIQKLQETGWGRFSVINPSNSEKSQSQTQEGSGDYVFDVEDASDLRQKRDNLLSQFEYLNIPKEHQLKMAHMNQKDLVDTLNSRINSFTSDTQPKDVQYFNLKDTTVISAVGPNSQRVGGRALFRNITGKFAWEFSYIQALDLKAFEEGKKSFDELNQKTLVIDSASLFDDDNVQKQKSNNLGPPVNLEIRKGSSTNQRDIFQTLFDYIKENVKDFVEYNPEPMKKSIDSISAPVSDPFEDQYEKAKTFEEKKMKNYKRNHEIMINKNKDTKEESQNKQIFNLGDHLLTLSNYDGIRMLLSNLGFLTPFKEMELNVFENDKSNGQQTTLNLLDAASARETVKIGVIFVAKGQDNQRDILKNTSGSPLYEEFIYGLGEKVSLRNHLGFQAGLKYKTDGDHAIYHSDALTEIMFHIATMMPTEAEDDQVLNKKKHVGNDHVNIIWCENYRGYRRNTITSQYNFVQVVIYPMKFNLCKIVVNKKDGINYLFPWIDNMIISREHLPLLVKLCSVHGFRKSKPQKESPFKFYQKRNEFLKELDVSEAQNNMSPTKKRNHAFEIYSTLLIN